MLARYRQVTLALASFVTTVTLIAATHAQGLGLTA